MKQILIRSFTLVFLSMCILLFAACEEMESTNDSTFIDETVDETVIDTVIEDGFTSGFPVVSINTSGADIDSKEIYTTCTISILDTNQAFNLNQASAGIRLRGHSTSNFEKSPYRIRFDEKTQPLGLGTGPSRSWVLLAEYVDISMMRNFITYQLANQLLRTSFKSDAQFVELFINDIHQGIYLLTEQTQVGEFRVNINEDGVDNPLIVDTGFLLELELDLARKNDEGPYMEAWFDIPGYTDMETVFTWENTDQYLLSSDIAFYVIKSDANSPEQIEFIRNYLVDVYDAIYIDQSFESIDALIDINSAVDMYLLQLITDDYDYNFSSNYVYKDQGGKLVFGPPWDHDLSYGNHYLNTSADQIHMYHLLYELSSIQWFQEIVLERFDEILDPSHNLIDQMDQTILSLSLDYEDEWDRNHALWSGTRRSDGWHIIYSKFANQEQAIEALRNWLDDRITWMESYFSSWQTD